MVHLAISNTYIKVCTNGEYDMIITKLLISLILVLMLVRKNGRVAQTAPFRNKYLGQNAMAGGQKHNCSELQLCVCS